MADQTFVFEPREEGEFEPLSIESWSETFYVSPVDFGGGVPGSQPSGMDAPGTYIDLHDH